MLRMIISGKLWNNPLFASVIFTYITSSHLPPTPPPLRHLCGPSVQPFWATSAASSQSYLPWCWPPCPGVAFAPSLWPQSNPFYLDDGLLVLELPLRHLRGLSQTLFTWRLATLSWSCLCATSAASVKPSLPGGWPPCPGVASAPCLRSLSQTLLTWRLATLSWSCLCATSVASVKPFLPGGWPPCPWVVSASPPQPQSNPLNLEAGHLVLELPLRHVSAASVKPS